MDILDHYSIPVSGLRDGLHEFDFSVGPEFFQCFPECPVKAGDVSVHLTFDKRPDLYVMDFDISGTLRTNCDRCLEEFDLPIEDSQTLLVKFDEKEHDDADVVYILKGTQKLNVASYIYDFVLLAMPMVSTHEEAGESCDPEMLKFIERSQEDDSESSTDVWDSLKGLNLEN